MGTSSLEKELKFGDVDLDALRERMQDFEAECQGSAALEDNWIFDKKDKLASKGELLRVRVDRRGSRITYKGKAHFEDGLKIRSELETGVEDFETTCKIFEALGYSLVRRYQKYREDWLLGSIIISLDHTPIGDFAEFEGEGCDRVAKRCGLDPETAEKRNYLKLYEDYLVDHPDAPPDMVFP